MFGLSALPRHRLNMGADVHLLVDLEKSNRLSRKWRPGLAWPGLAWPGLAWPGLAWLGLAWLGLAWPGLAWLGLAWLGGVSQPLLSRSTRTSFKTNPRCRAGCRWLTAA